MCSFISRPPVRASRARLFAVACAAVAASVGVGLTLTGTAQAHDEPWYDQPAPVTQPLQAWSGNANGQTSAPASYASVLCVGSTASVSVHLDRTNQEHTSLLMWYLLDNGSWTRAAGTLTTNGTGTGSGTFTVDDLSAGNHQIALDINVDPGGTYYLNATRNNNGTIGIYFACPPS